MQLASSSYKHEIPGVYTLSIGGGSAPKPLVSHGSKEKLLSSNFIADQELVPNAKAATDIYDWLSHRTKKTITALDLSANLTGVKAGIAATGLNVSVALNGVDVSVKVGIVSVAYQWFPIKINNGDIIIHKAKAKKDKLTYSDRSVVVGSDLSKIKLEKSAYFMHLSSNSHEITVGPNTIVLTNDGVVIKSNGIVHIDGDLHVSGDVLMGKALSVVDSIYVGGGAKIGERMVDSSINKPDPFIPSVAIQGLRNIASVQLKKIIIEAALNKVDVEAQVAVGAASVVAAEAVGDVAAGGAADAPAV